MQAPLRSQAARQTETQRADTLAIIDILEEKRAEVMTNDCAGYFIKNWQELTDQVRQLIAADSRYQAMRDKSGITDGTVMNETGFAWKRAHNK